ncbi:uncharacterized protein LOC126755201 [Bactrocera neohumeralis]|uniref:uncharacterized protein LOC120772353 n=1 Tax=Bactrocera tryoni TaxID=59916 RepID=UPI001A962C38|nr:uncharacterized protein LOC120772353 [Bactrocera tryoni]XP_050323554.1 uncharacterized protein LOC126755201 [Bactrocera neohumeralis]
MPVKVFQNMSLKEEVNPGQGEQNPVIITGTTAQTETNADVSDAAQEPQVTRELTQTDRINKHLLKSFLDRINTSGIMEQFSTNTSQTTTAQNDHDDFEEQLFIGTQIM